MHKRELELLALLLEATRGGRAVWRRTSDDLLQTKVAGLVCSFRFLYPVLVGEENSDPDIVEARVGTAASKFYSGSEGFDLIREIVAAADEGFRERDQRMLEQQLVANRRLRVRLPLVNALPQKAK